MSLEVGQHLCITVKSLVAAQEAEAVWLINAWLARDVGCEPLAGYDVTRQALFDVPLE